jgi:hypothetical protein
MWAQTDAQDSDRLIQEAERAAKAGVTVRLFLISHYQFDANMAHKPRPSPKDDRAPPVPTRAWTNLDVISDVVSGLEALWENLKRFMTSFRLSGKENGPSTEL